MRIGAYYHALTCFFWDNIANPINICPDLRNSFWIYCVWVVSQIGAVFDGICLFGLIIYMFLTVLTVLVYLCCIILCFIGRGRKWWVASGCYAALYWVFVCVYFWPASHFFAFVSLCLTRLWGYYYYIYLFFKKNNNKEREREINPRTLSNTRCTEYRAQTTKI